MTTALRDPALRANAPEFEAVVGEVPRLSLVVDCDAHEGPPFTLPTRTLCPSRRCPSRVSTARRLSRSSALSWIARTAFPCWWRRPTQPTAWRRMKRRRAAGLRAGHALRARSDQPPGPRDGRARDRRRHLARPALHTPPTTSSPPVTGRSGSPIRAMAISRIKPEPTVGDSVYRYDPPPHSSRSSPTRSTSQRPRLPPDGRTAAIFVRPSRELDQQV
jgi:hypothetical protein